MTETIMLSAMSHAEVTAKVITRARMKLALKGMKNSTKIELDLTALEVYGRLPRNAVTEDVLARLSHSVAEDTWKKHNG